MTTGNCPWVPTKNSSRTSRRSSRLNSLPTTWWRTCKKKTNSILFIIHWTSSSSLRPVKNFWNVKIPSWGPPFRFWSFLELFNACEEFWMRRTKIWKKQKNLKITINNSNKIRHKLLLSRIWILLKTFQKRKKKSLTDCLRVETGSLFV